MNMHLIYIRPASPWTDERVATLRQMWDDGYSASVIADHLGLPITRNAVIGKVHRLGLGGRGSPIQGQRKPAQRRKPRPAPVVTIKPVVPAPEPSVARVEPEWIAEYNCHIQALRFPISQCRWIDGEPTAEALYCGARTVPGTSWCPTHNARFTASVPRRQSIFPVRR